MAQKGRKADSATGLAEGVRNPHGRKHGGHLDRPCLSALSTRSHGPPLAEGSTLTLDPRRRCQEEVTTVILPSHSCNAPSLFFWRRPKAPSQALSAAGARELQNLF